jgi:RimJ/RimL family protein N-acetyltransferase
VDIPDLETDRLLLREWRESDLDAYARMCADEEFARYFGDPLDRDDAWRQLALYVGHWELRGFGLWAVEEKASGAFVGRVGLYQPEGWPGLEVGWGFDPAVWGRGYATESGRASLDYAWSVLGADRVISIIDPDNARSIAVAERLGETFERRWRLRTIPVLIYGIDRP